MKSATALAISGIERGMVPDGFVRAGIRRLLLHRLSELGAGDPEVSAQRGEGFAAELATAPVALVPEKANEQHYELPAEFFAEVLGPHRKYSACCWGRGARDLQGAEADALAATCARADLRDGQDILELGCGWGSLTLWIAGRYPGAHITAVSNSHSQKAFIDAEARRRHLANVHVVTRDMNVFDVPERFDRVISVEMFEHLRNWPEMFRRVAGWLEPGGRFFLHVFAHRSTPYAFVERDAGDWMSRHFFAGGMMPSDDLALRFQDDLRLLHRWRWGGQHYAATANAWLANMDLHRDAVWPILEDTYGTAQAGRWWTRWRVFFMSCAELFAWDNGREWGVSHYQFERRR